MNLNPLENEKCQYEISAIYKKGECTCELTEKGEEIRGEDNYNGYHTLIRSITDKINWIIKEIDADCQGNAFYLGKDKDEKYYFLNHSYGSCSGCDAYKASRDSSLQDLSELRDEIKRGIRQFDSLEEFKRYLISEASKSNCWYHSDDYENFIIALNQKYDWSLVIDE